MLSRTTINIIRKSMCSNARTLYYVRNTLQSNFLTHNNCIKEYDIQNHYILYMAKRFKSNRRKITDTVINNDNSHLYIFIFSCFIKNFLTWIKRDILKIL